MNGLWWALAASVPALLVASIVVAEVTRLQVPFDALRVAALITTVVLMAAALLRVDRTSR